MTQIYIAIGAIVGAYITIALALWGVVYQNGKLKELVKQKEEEIKKHEIIRENLVTLWEDYALAPDDELIAAAIVFKNRLLAMAEEAK